MAETWDSIQRQVILRANQLQANSATALSTSYETSTIGQTEMGDRAIEFPMLAINDAILNAGDRLVNVIGLDIYSPYRNYFADVTASLTTGSSIPLISDNSQSRVGLIGAVRDSSTEEKLVAKDYKDVVGISKLTLKQSPNWYYTDNVRIWHTNTSVICDIVVWDKSTQLLSMGYDPSGDSDPTRGECPFPQDLHEALVCGALSYIFRGDFNNSQVSLWRGYFNNRIEELGIHVVSEEVEKRKITE